MPRPPPRTDPVRVEEIEAACRKIIAIFPKVVTMYYAGKPAIGALVHFAIQEVYPEEVDCPNPYEFLDVMLTLLEEGAPNGQNNHD